LVAVVVLLADRTQAFVHHGIPACCPIDCFRNATEFRTPVGSSPTRHSPTRQLMNGNVRVGVRVGGDPPATREDVQNDLRKCLGERIGNLSLAESRIMIWDGYYVLRSQSLVRYPTDSLVPKRNDRQKIKLNVEILEGHLGCMKSTHSMNAATWGR